MKKVFIIHGFEGEPNGGWRPWLMAELAQKDIYACALPMPDPYNPKKEEWVETINRAVPEPNRDVFLVGHSLGVPAILKYLENLNENTKIGGVVLVSGPHKKLKTEDATSKLRKIDNFFEPEFNFKKIKNSCDRFVIIHGDNDNRVPFEHAEFLSQQLNIKPTIAIGGLHLSGGEGHTKLPQALNALEEMMK